MAPSVVPLASAAAPVIVAPYGVSLVPAKTIFSESEAANVPVTTSLASIRRRQLFELHDFDWWPSSLRWFLTELLALTWAFPWIRWKIGGERLIPSFADLAYQVMEPEIKRAASSAFDHQTQDGSVSQNAAIIDLCSGTGGPWRGLIQRVAPDTVDVILTDLYPPSPMPPIQEVNGSTVRQYPSPVDATAVPDELTGLRTMFNCFHHFTPELATAIIRDVVHKNERVVVVDTAQRSFAQFIGAGLLMFPASFLIPILHFRQTPWYLFPLTYLIPIAPLVCAFDGMISCARGYKSDELLAIAGAADVDDQYRWTAGHKSFLGLFSLCYLTGEPVQGPSLPVDV